MVHASNERPKPIESACRGPRRQRNCRLSLPQSPRLVSFTMFSVAFSTACYTEFTLRANIAMAAALSIVLGVITWLVLNISRSLAGSTVAAAG